SRIRRRKMPVGSSPAAAPTRQSKSVCNIRQLPKIVNVQFPDKSGQGGGLSLTNGGSFRPDYCKVPAGMDWTTRQSRLVGLRRRRNQFNHRSSATRTCKPTTARKNGECEGITIRLRSFRYPLLWMI